LGNQHVVSVFALSAGGDLDSFSQQVEAFGDVPLVSWPQVIEGSHADRYSVTKTNS